MSVTSIVVKFDLEGGHHWPEAPKDFKHLKVHHHHIFHFECYIPVGQDNRELEFLVVRRELMTIMKDAQGSPCDFEDMSCETIAKLLAVIIEKKYGVRATRIVVMEDAFVGAELYDAEGVINLKSYLTGGLKK